LLRRKLSTLYPQVYADLGAINWLIPREEFHAYLQALVRAGFGKEIMFGSDQMIWLAKFLTCAQKRDIFYNSAMRFFRLDKR
jgi:predicted TIM-barrel fold metal-dependent hydrolase